MGPTEARATLIIHPVGDRSRDQFWPLFAAICPADLVAATRVQLMGAGAALALLPRDCFSNAWRGETTPAGQGERAACPRSAWPALRVPWKHKAPARSLRDCAGGGVLRRWSIVALEKQVGRPSCGFERAANYSLRRQGLQNKAFNQRDAGVCLSSMSIRR
jgi:hypothetical protein